MKVKQIGILIFFTVLSFSINAQSNDTILTANEISIFPNPAINEIQVLINNSDLENPRITLHSLIGNVINTEISESEPNQFHIDLRGLPQGYYFVSIKDREFNKTYKFLKK